jgi:hypothetical protein
VKSIARNGNHMQAKNAHPIILDGRVGAERHLGHRNDDGDLRAVDQNATKD